MQEQPRQPTSISSRAGRSRGHFEPSRVKIRPRNPSKNRLARKSSFLCQKKAKSEIRQNLIQLNEIGPNLDTSIACQRRRSPSASIDYCQWRRSPRASSAKRSSQPQPKPIAEPRGYPKHPGALSEGGHPRPATHPNPEVEPRGPPWSGSNSFFGRSSAQEARRRKRDVI